MAEQVMLPDEEDERLHTMAEGQPPGQPDKRPDGWTPLLRYLLPGRASARRSAGPPKQVHKWHGEPGSPVEQRNADARITVSATSQGLLPTYGRMHKMAKIGPTTIMGQRDGREAQGHIFRPKAGVCRKTALPISCPLGHVLAGDRSVANGDCIERGTVTSPDWLPASFQIERILHAISCLRLLALQMRRRHPR